MESRRATGEGQHETLEAALRRHPGPGPHLCRATVSVLTIALGLAWALELNAQPEAQFDHTPGAGIVGGKRKAKRKAKTASACAQICLGYEWCAAFIYGTHNNRCSLYSDPGRAAPSPGTPFDYYARRRSGAEVRTAHVVPDLSGQWQTPTLTTFDFRRAAGSGGHSFHVQVASGSKTKVEWRVRSAVLLEPRRAGDSWRIRLDTTQRQMVGVIARDGQSIDWGPRRWARVGGADAIWPVQSDRPATPSLPVPGREGRRTKLTGATLRAVRVRRGQPSCKKLCIREPACVAYSESKRVDGGGGFFTACELKRSVGTPARHDQWVSWIKPGVEPPLPGKSAGATLLVGRTLSVEKVGLDARVCDSACEKNRRCVGRSWSRSQGGECRLFDEVTGAQQSFDWSSSVPRGPPSPGFDVLMPATTLLGDDLEIITPSEQDACRRACEAAEACKAFAFGSKSKTCELKAKVGPTARRNGWVALIRSPVVDLSELANQLVTIRNRAACAQRGPYCNQHVSFSGQEPKLFPANNDQGLVPWRLVPVPGRKDEFYIHNRWRCELGEPRCDWHLSLSGSKATLAAKSSPADLVPWKLVPVRGKKDQYHLRSQWGCERGEARCNQHLTFAVSGLKLSSGRAPIRWQIRGWPSRPVRVARTKVEVRKYLHPSTGGATKGPVTVSFAPDGTELPTYTILSDVAVRRVRSSNTGPAAILADGDFDSSTQRWPDNRVPYEIVPGHPNAHNIQQAIALWNSKVNIQWVPREADDAKYIEITVYVPTDDRDTRQGWSFIGRQIGVSAQELSIRGDAKVTTSLHEMGHAVGLRHEFGSPVRDQYITVHHDRMKESCVSQYEIATGAEHGECAFDAGSMMMYSPRACMNDLKKEVYELKEDALTEDMIERWNERWIDKDETSALSPCDVQGLNELYPGPAPTSGPPTCDSKDDCGGGACSRPEAGNDEKVCCPSGKDELRWGYFYCTELENGKRCWTDGQCASDNCDHETWKKKGTCKAN